MATGQSAEMPTEEVELELPTTPLSVLYRPESNFITLAWGTTFRELNHVTMAVTILLLLKGATPVISCGRSHTMSLSSLKLAIVQGAGHETFSGQFRRIKRNKMHGYHTEDAII